MLAQSIEFGHVFQLETILGENYWHGYVKVDFLDPWDGANLESYMAIDFIELAVSRVGSFVIPAQAGIHRIYAVCSARPLDPYFRGDDGAR